MRPTTSALLSVVLTIVACSEPTAPFISLRYGRWDSGIRAFDPPSGREREAAKTLARAIAAGLADLEAREDVFDAFVSSKNREGKVHVPSFMQHRAQRLSVAAEARGISVHDVRDALRDLRELEMYVPVSSHRAKWTKGEVPLVAVALSEDDSPVAYGPDGEVVFLTRDFPPSRPVIVLAPRETDLSAQMRWNAEQGPVCAGRHFESLEAARARCKRESPRGRSAALTMAELNGLYMEHLELYGDQCHEECWFWGDPEYEIHVLWAADSTASSPLRDHQCIGATADQTDGSNPGVKSPEIVWDMNGRTWTQLQRLLFGFQVDSVDRASGRFILQLWEDDSNACRITGAAFSSLGMLATFFGGVITGVSLKPALVPGAAAGTWVPVIMGALLISYAIADVFNGGDDFVGGFFVPQGSFTATANTNQVLLFENQLRGRARIRLYDASPPPVGPTVAVTVSYQDNFLIPVGAQKKFHAFAVDADGRGAGDRAVSWASSNTSIATVDGDGWVSGLSSGTVSITASVDGFSNQVQVSIVPYGPAAVLSLTPAEVDLSTGQTQQLVARFYDSNGFQLPLGTTTVVYTSANSNVCSVSPSGVVTATTSGVDWTTMSAEAEGLSSGSVSCSVNGGDPYSIIGRRSNRPTARRLARP